MLSYDELIKLYEKEKNLKIYYQDLVKKLRKSLGEEHELRIAAEEELKSLKKKAENNPKIGQGSNRFKYLTSAPVLSHGTYSSHGS